MVNRFDQGRRKAKRRIWDRKSLTLDVDLPLQIWLGSFGFVSIYGRLLDSWTSLFYFIFIFLRLCMHDK